MREVDVMSSVSDSLMAVGMEVIDDIGNDDNGDMVKMLAIICIVFIGFVGWLVITLIKNGLNQRQVNRDTNEKVNVISKKEDHVCNAHNGMIDLLMSIKADIDEVSLFVQKKDNEQVSEKKRSVIMRSKVMDVLPMFYDADIKKFAVAKSTMFIGFVLDNLELLNQKDGYDLFKQMFINKAEEAINVGVHIIGKDRVDKFYASSHKYSVKEYLINIRKIHIDTTNDKVNRFFNLSILFMQEFLSQINMIQNPATKHDGFVIDNDKSNIAKDFQALEKAYLNIKESISGIDDE